MEEVREADVAMTCNEDTKYEWKEYSIRMVVKKKTVLDYLSGILKLRWKPRQERRRWPRNRPRARDGQPGEA